MYLDTTILQSRTTTTLVEFIDEIVSYISPEELPEDLLLKYQEIKKQQRKAKKLDSRGKRLSQE